MNELIVQEQYPLGTVNPTAVVYNGLATRILNTIAANDAPDSMAVDTETGIITLQPGTYSIEGDAVAHGETGTFQNMLINTATGAAYAFGLSLNTPGTGYLATSSQSSPIRSGNIVVDADETLSVALASFYGGTATGATVNYGEPASAPVLGAFEVYASLRIVKKA